jgi:hypothetical protein
LEEEEEGFTETDDRYYMNSLVKKLFEKKIKIWIYQHI